METSGTARRKREAGGNKIERGETRRGAGATTREAGRCELRPTLRLPLRDLRPPRLPPAPSPSVPSVHEAPASLRAAGGWQGRPGYHGLLRPLVSCDGHGVRARGRVYRAIVGVLCRAGRIISFAGSGHGREVGGRKYVNANA